MAEIAKLAIRLQQISSCAAVTSSGETVLHHTHVGEILSALHDVTSELLANREAQPVGFRYRHKDTVSWLYNDWRWPDSVEVEQCQIEWLYPAPPAPAVPPEATPDNIENLLADITLFFTAGSLSHGGSVMFAEVWNACRAAMLAAAPEGGN
jgi:hypothetical protein